jgi:hypothetical protein
MINQQSFVGNQQTQQSEATLINQSYYGAREPTRSFMDEYEYSRAHIAEDPDNFVQNMRFILSALG